MNILYICDEFPPGKTGGIGSVIDMLAKKLSEQNHHIYVVGLYPHGYGGLDFEEQGNVKIWRLRYQTDAGLISGKDTLKDKIITHTLRKTGVLNIDATHQLKKMFSLISSLVKEYHINVIEIPDWNNFFFNVRLKNILIPDFNVPVIVKMHGSSSYFKAEQGLSVPSEIFSKELYLYHRADALASVSLYTANYCKALYQLKNDVQILYNGINIEPYPDFEKRLNNNKVIFSGSLLPKKGIYSLVKSWKNVLMQIPHATLHIYGKGNTSLLKDMLDQETSPSVFFYGHVPREKLLEELATANLAVFPSYSETFGLGVVEAMGAGCPVIYTKKSCGPEIISDRKEGILVDPDNISEISRAIIMLLDDQPLRKNISLAGYEKVKANFDIEQVAIRHIHFYEKVMADYKARQSL